MSFSTTIVTGVQDISALLPLLGTDQIEKHVGSALAGGYLYSSITPISMFGSLGAVKNAFSVVTASIAYYHFPGTFGIKRPFKLLGAKWLYNAGFQPKGTVACLLGFKRLSETEEIYVAEDILKMLLQERYVEDVDKLKIEWNLTKGFWWHLRLVFWSSIFALISILPYVPIFIDKGPDSSNFPLWIFPVIRAFGTVGITLYSQVIMQIRIMQITRSCITVMTMEKNYPDKIRGFKGWDDRRPSEECLWNLRRHFQQSKPSPESVEGKMDEKLESKKYVPAERFLLVSSWILIIPCTLLTVTGYVGSFNLVQNASTPSGPLLWLGLEVVLSLVRMAIWAWDPTFDAHPGISFNLINLTPSLNFPLVTSNEFDDETDEKVLPVLRSEDFLADITTYVGPVEKFEHGEISIYYTLTGSLQETQEDARALYLTVHDYKERAPSVVVRRSWDGVWCYFAVKSAEWDNLQVILGDKIKKADNHFTGNDNFLKHLKDHCTMVALKLSKSLQDPKSRHEPEAFTINWSLTPRALPISERPHDSKVFPTPPLTEGDKRYLEHGRKERKIRHRYRLWGWWNEELMSMVREEYSRELPKLSTPPMISERREVNELEYLLITESVEMEAVMRDEFQVTEEELLGDHRKMIEEIIAFLDPKDSATHEEKKTTPIINSKTSAAQEEVIPDPENPVPQKEEKTTSIKRRLSEEQSTRVTVRARRAREEVSNRQAKEWKARRLRRTDIEYDLSYEKELKQEWEARQGERQKGAQPTSTRGGSASTSTSVPASQGSLHERLAAESKKMEERFAADEEAIAKIKDNTLRIESAMAEAEVIRRCTARRSLMAARLEGEQIFAKANESLLQTLEFLSEDSARGKMASMLRFTRSKYTRYLDISNELIQSTTAEQLACLLRLNTATSVVSVTAYLDLHQANMIADAIKDMTRIMSVSVQVDRWLFDEETLKALSSARETIADRVQSQSSLSGPIITYQDVSVTDLYRRDNPYLLLANGSQCTIRFSTDGHSSQKDLRLYHCPTTLEARFDIVLDDKALVEGCDERFYKEYFGWDTCRITNIPEGEHTLIIRVVDRSPSEYWVSDVDVADVDDVDDSGQSGLTLEPRAYWKFDYPPAAIMGRV